MNVKFYLYASIIGSLIVCFNPQKAASQCNCSPGVPATPVTHYFVLDTTDAPSSIISFPLFDSQIGSLSCVEFYDTLSLISTSGVRNEATLPPGGITYRFLLSVTNEINGPGVSVFEPTTRNYGPSLLAPYGTPGDSTTYGPDTLFNSSTHHTSSSSVADYLGSSGTADFVYTVNGGLTSQQGGLSYSYQIKSHYWGAFRLTYYWCPHTPLAVKNKKPPVVTPTASNEANTQPLSVYPNPVSGSKFSLQFNKAVTGSYMVDVVNITGQKIYSKSLQLSNTSLAPVDMNTPPPPGLYYLRAVDQRTGAIYTNKLLVK